MPVMLEVVLRIILFVAGAYLAGWTVMSAIRSFVLPRGDNVALTRFVFRRMSMFYRLMAKRAKTYAEQDRIMALFAPVTLLLLPVVWLFLILIGYTCIFFALGEGTLYESFKISGSSLYTLGFFTVESLQPNGMAFVATIIEFTEATIGLGLIAIVISYLPTMYAAFSRREQAVNLLEIRAGNPPSAVEMILRFHRIQGLERLNDYWSLWELWFADIEESHTVLPALVFFRSPRPQNSWVVAAGTVLDAAALTLSAVDTPISAAAQLSIRAGYICLARIADYFQISYPVKPRFPDVKISISRDEFNAALDQLAESGVPLKTDRERAWIDFAGWRVNYDFTLLTLARLTMAPATPWTSDRAPR